MQQISINMKNHLKNEVTTLCHCWRIHRQDGKVLGLTDHDQLVQLQGVDYYANSGMTPSAVEQSTNLSPDGMQLTGILDTPHISKNDLKYGLYDGADIQLWLVNWSDPEQAILITQGIFGEIRQKGGGFVVDLKGTEINLQYPEGRTYQKKCDANLGNERCTINTQLINFTTNVEIIDVNGLEITIEQQENFENGWFAYGDMKFITGELKDTNFLIKEDNVAGEKRILILWDTMPDIPQIGDTIQITAGCDKCFETCKTKFQNQINFQGMPHMPSANILISVKP